MPPAGIIRSLTPGRLFFHVSTHPPTSASSLLPSSLQPFTSRRKMKPKPQVLLGGSPCPKPEEKEVKRCSEHPPISVISEEGSRVSKPGRALAIHKPPSTSAVIAAHLLPWCLLPPSGLTLTCKRKKPATKPVERRVDSGENWPWETPGSRPTLPHLRPKGGHRESFQDLDAKQIEAGIWGTLRAHSQRVPSPPQPRGFSQASPLITTEQAQPPERAQVKHQEGARGPRHPREGPRSVTLLLLGGLCQKGNKKESYSRGLLWVRAFSSPSASKPPGPQLSQCSRALPPKPGLWPSLAEMLLRVSGALCSDVEGLEEAQ